MIDHLRRNLRKSYSIVDTKPERAGSWAERREFDDNLVAAYAMSICLDANRGRVRNARHRPCLAGGSAEGWPPSCAKSCRVYVLRPSSTDVVQLTCHPLFVPKHQKTALSAVMR